ncbi:MAG: hypothetical protein ACI35P_01305 [Bacillus sp. (in: firmicutes)]
MDKLDRKKNTITIKINNNDKAYIDELKKEEKEEISQKKEEGIEKKATTEPVNEEETIIETAATQEEESFEWVLPEKKVEQAQKNGLFVSKKASVKQKTLRQERNLRNLLISIIVAVLLGSGFGFVVWQTITEKAEPTSTVPTVEPNSHTTSPTSPSTTISIPNMSVTVVQAGVFNNKESAEHLQTSLIDQNVSSVVLPVENQYYTLLAISDSLDNAKVVSLQYREDGIDAFWKELQIGGDKKLTQNEMETLTAAQALYKQLVAAVSAPDSVQAGSLDEALSTIKSKSEEEKNMESMVSTLSNAVAITKGKSENEEKSKLLQQQLLQFVVLYKTFVDA